MRTPAAIRKYPLTEAANTATGCRWKRKQLEAKNKPEIRLAGSAKKDWRHQFVFVSMLFDIIDLLKRYVGGLVVIDGWTLHIGSLGFRPDDESVSFTVWRLRFFWNDARQTGLISVPYGAGTMCRGSYVKDSAAMCFQLESLILAQNERWRQA